MTHRRQLGSERPPPRGVVPDRPRVGDLQSLAGNRAVAGLLGPRSIQRDTDYDPFAPYRGWSMQRLMGLDGAGAGGSVSSGVAQGVGAAASVAATAADLDLDPDTAPLSIEDLDPTKLAGGLKNADSALHMFEDVQFFNTVNSGVEIGTAVGQTVTDVADALPLGLGKILGLHDAGAGLGKDIAQAGGMLEGAKFAESAMEQFEFNEVVDAGAGFASGIEHDVSGFLGKLPFAGGDSTGKAPHRDPAPWPGAGTPGDPYQLPPLIFGKDGSMQEGTGAPGDPIILPPYYGNDDDKAVDGRK